MESDFGSGILPGDSEENEREETTSSSSKSGSKKTSKKKTSKRKKTATRSRSRTKKAASAEEDVVEAAASPADAPEEGEEPKAAEEKPRRTRKRRSPEEREARKREAAAKLGREPDETLETSSGRIVIPGAEVQKDVSLENDPFGAGLLPPEELDEIAVVNPPDERMEAQDEDEAVSSPSSTGRRERGREGRGRERVRGRERDQERSREAEGDQDRDTDRGRDRDRGRSRGRGDRESRRDRDQDRGNRRDRDRGSDRDRDQDRGSRRDRDRNREDRGRGRDRDRGRRERSEGSRDSGRSRTPQGQRVPSIPVPLQHRNSQRVALLVDLDELEARAQEDFGGHLSANGLLEQLLQGRQNPRTIGYQGNLPENRRKILLSQGFDTLIEEEDRARKLVRLSTDALALSARVDAVVIASTDPGLTPLIEYLAGMGLKVEIGCFGPMPSAFEEAQSRGASQVGLGAESVFIP